MTHQQLLRTALVIPAGAVPWSVCGVLCPAQPPPLRLLP